MNRQVDAKLSWRRSLEPDQFWFFFDYERGFCGVIPIWGGYHRLFFRPTTRACRIWTRRSTRSRRWLARSRVTRP